MSTDARAATRPTIVLIHGLWLTPRSWENWIAHFEKTGFDVIAPAWPGVEGEVEAVRKDPAKLKGLRLKTVVDHYERIIRDLDAPPIIMGHSFGGLIVQLLLDRGLGVAGVAIDSAQTAAVPTLPFSTVWATISVLGNPFSMNGATSLSPSKFNYAFTNELTPGESQKVYDRYQIPAANRILWDGALALLNPRASSKVDYANGTRAPLLFIAGSADHLVPPSINKANVRKYIGKSNAITDYREFPNRTHHIVGQEGWEEVADFALTWAMTHAKIPVTFEDVNEAFTADSVRTGETAKPPAMPDLRELH
jgi:pimeloyl-ACP methyl ester carboxylesterase